MARSEKVIVGPGRPRDIVTVCAIATVAALLPALLPSSPWAWFFGVAAGF